MQSPTPRRRSDDWKETSNVRLRAHVYRDMARGLGYDPADVMSIRMNCNEVIVTHRGNGVPRSVRHELVDE